MENSRSCQPKTHRATSKQAARYNPPEGFRNIFYRTENEKHLVSARQDSRSVPIHLADNCRPPLTASLGKEAETPADMVAFS